MADNRELVCREQIRTSSCRRPYISCNSGVLSLLGSVTKRLFVLIACIEKHFLISLLY